MEEKSLNNKSNNIFLASLNNRADANFFNSTPKAEWDNIVQEKPARGSRINDYDSTILENNAYQTISDEVFKIEHKIEILEQTLSKLNTEIETMESFGYGIQVYNLKERKRKIEQELVELNEKYCQFGIGAKLSGQIASAVNSTSRKNTSIFAKFKKIFIKRILTKLSKKIGYSQLMSDALNNLSGINSSVDELINMQVPYGESISRYEKLTAYLNKANVLHSQINKNIDKITKKKV